MGVTQGAGLSLQWFRNRLAPGTAYDELTAEAHIACGAQGLFWLPYLMGERTPHLDATARGAWIGLTAKHQRSDLVARRSRRRLLQPARLPGDHRSAGRARVEGPALRRRAQEPVLASDVCRYFRRPGSDLADAGGLGLRRGAAGAGWNRTIFQRQGSVRGVIREVETGNRSECGKTYYIALTRSIARSIRH